MSRLALIRLCVLACSLILLDALRLPAQAVPADNLQISNSGDEELKFVVILTRHGVRSPTDKSDKLNLFSAQPWPTWSVPPGYLTEHGAKLMRLFGAYDREMLVRQHLLSNSGCVDAKNVTIIADSDQRTRETGKAMAEGLLPGCAIEIHALPEGTRDPLFHSIGTEVGYPEKQVATAAVSGRIGGNPAGLAEAYRPQLQAMEDILLGCKPGTSCPKASGKETSLFDVPAMLSPGKSDHLVDLHGPLGTAATMAENILLEYTEGMDLTQVGWGQVDRNKLRELMQIHTANEDITQRTLPIARAQSSNMLTHILNSLEQAVKEKTVPGALSKPQDRLLLLVGHDTNLANVSGALGLSWLIDGRRDDTPPGGALVFELWQKRGTSDYTVRTFYTAQTLDQMRNAKPLDLDNPPERVPIFVPGCSRADLSCEWKSFRQTTLNASAGML